MPHDHGLILTTPGVAATVLLATFIGVLALGMVARRLPIALTASGLHSDRIRTPIRGAQQMARASDVDKMSYAELAAMEKQIEKLKIEKQNTERLELRQKLVDEAKKNGFDINDLFGRGSGRSRGKVAAKYRDPKNPGNTWTGRGRMPRWMTAATKGGKAKKDDFLI
jgi:DNA-binding protein H-NS